MSDMPEKVNRKNCGSVLKSIRNNYGKMLLEDLARILGVSRSTIMRIEDGRTLPSDEFINRLKALQLIGLSKFKQLAEKDKTKFSQIIDDIGGNHGKINAAIATKMLKELTPFGIISGIGSIGMSSLAVTTSVLATIPLTAAGLAGYGIIKGLKSILDANDLKCVEVNGRWEITTKETEGENNVK